MLRRLAHRYGACTGVAPVIQSIERTAIVETLLNSLEAERYVRGPLLATVVDELSASGEELAMAAVTARGILQRWEAGQLDDPELTACVSALRPLVQVRHGAPRASAA